MPQSLQEDWILLWAGRIALTVTGGLVGYFMLMHPNGPAPWRIFADTLPMSCAAAYCLAYFQIAALRRRPSRRDDPKWRADITRPLAPTKFTRTPHHD